MQAVVSRLPLQPPLTELLHVGSVFKAGAHCKKEAKVPLFMAYQTSAIHTTRRQRIVMNHTHTIQ